MTAPSGKDGWAEAARGSAAAAAPVPSIESASRRVHFVARGSAFMSMAPFSGSATNAASKDSGIVGKLGAQDRRVGKGARGAYLERPRWARFALPTLLAFAMLLERNLDKASQLTRMQALRFLGFKLFKRLQADLKMLADALAVEFAGHAGEFDLAMEGFIRHAEQRAVRYAKAKAVGGDRCRLHVECNGARLRQASNDGRTANLPIAIIDARDRSGAHHAL